MRNPHRVREYYTGKIHKAMAQGKPIRTFFSQTVTSLAGFGREVVKEFWEKYILYMLATKLNYPCQEHCLTAKLAFTRSLFQKHFFTGSLLRDRFTWLSPSIHIRRPRPKGVPPFRRKGDEAHVSFRLLLLPKWIALFERAGWLKLENFKFELLVSNQLSRQ